jgi:hypothetical protein
VSLPQTSPSVGLTHLDRADLTVLDLGLSYLLDALREDPDVLPAPEERVALRDLHRQVLDLKLSTGEVGEEPPERREFWRAPSGRVHSLRGCSGGPGPHRMRKTELTKLEFDALMVGGFASRHEDERCRCATWRDTP